MKFDRMEIRWGDIDEVVIDHAQIWSRRMNPNKDVCWTLWRPAFGAFQPITRVFSDAEMREMVMRYRDDSEYRFWISDGTLNIVHDSIVGPHNEALSPTTFHTSEFKPVPTTFNVGPTTFHAQSS